jgi:hypothetical protein
VSLIDRWLAGLDDERAVARFRRVFFAIWLVYDLCDLYFRGTATAFDPFGLAPDRHPLLLVAQLGVMGCGVLLVSGRSPLFALAAVAFRGLECWIYPLNDFLYFVVISIWLAVPGDRKWQRDVLIWQTAWIYFATGLLKLNRDWLSGGHLFVRFGYIHTMRWPRIAADCTESLACLSKMAWIGVSGELAMVVLLIAGARFGRFGRRAAMLLAVGIHATAAIGLNVWFFGASMVAQVAMLSRGRNSV